MKTILHEGRTYLLQALVWAKYKEDIFSEGEPDGNEINNEIVDYSRLELGFSDGSVLKIDGVAASNYRGSIEETFGIEFLE